jgi:hypothetical protein
MKITSAGTGKLFGVSAVRHWVRTFIPKFRRPAESSGGRSSGEFAERDEVPAGTEVLLPIGPSCC